MERFTAKEARATTENNGRLLSKFYKWIKETAVRNSNNLLIGMHDFDDDVLDKVLTTLKEDGYRIETDDEHDSVIISW